MMNTELNNELNKMAWNQNQSPSSYQKPRRQQSSLQTDSSHDSFESCSSGVLRSPKTCLMNYEKFMQPMHQHSSDSDPGFYLTKNFKSSKTSENKAFDFELSSRHLKSSSPRHFYEDSSTDSAPATLNSPMKKYDYNAVSSNIKSENSAGLTKFEYSMPLKAPTDPKNSTDLYGCGMNKTEDERGGKPKLTPFTLSAEKEVYFATCNPRKNKTMKRHYNVSPDGVVSLDDYSSTSTTLLCEMNTSHNGRRMSITLSGENSSDISSTLNTESLDTSSLITQSTNFSHTTSVSPLPSPSLSGLSMATTASCNKMEPKQSQARPKSLYARIAEDDISNSEENISMNLNRRRHAINIINNPGYKTLHNSHSELVDGKRYVDRTCSDITDLLKHRKSTSDLTNDDEYQNEKASAQKHRRRGSSKGGLAYLVEKRDSRRGSRESVCSQKTYVSNEGIGPLTNFQQTQRGRQRRTSNFLELPMPDHARRPRVCSLPDTSTSYNPRVSEDLYRLRTFSISKGTVVNCGDSIISRRSKSNTSVNSTTSKLSERSPFEGSCCGGYTGENDSSDSEPTPIPRYRIVMLGEQGTGKSALVNQFMTSEYMHTYDCSLDDEFGEKTVSVLLDGEESELVFIDHPASEMSVENSLSTYEPHACILVYSIVQKSSFRVAEEILNYLWRENITKDKAVIVVGNKADLARSRAISTSDGKQLAASRDVKFIETSSGIQHNVDELLVGVLKQIRLKETREKRLSSRMKNSRTHASFHVAKEILQKICFNQLDITKSKSCENLHVL